MASRFLTDFLSIEQREAIHIQKLQKNEQTSLITNVYIDFIKKLQKTKKTFTRKLGEKWIKSSIPIPFYDRTFRSSWGGTRVSILTFISDYRYCSQSKSAHYFEVRGYN